VERQDVGKQCRTGRLFRMKHGERSPRREPMAGQIRGAASRSFDGLPIGAQLRMTVEHRSGQRLEVLRLLCADGKTHEFLLLRGLGSPQLLLHCGLVPASEAIDEGERVAPTGPGAEQEGGLSPSAGGKLDGAPQARDGVQHTAGRPGEGRTRSECARQSRLSAAAQKTDAIGFVLGIGAAE
jgi:hypothetical protein